ncbi:MAG: hypothetical protein H7Y27_14820 [Gemmatimonadaceae bacterium]|nr:hypothetical protein [Chitinophagaceae bacterium]
MKTILFILLVAVSSEGFAQGKGKPLNSFMDLTATAGSAQGTVAYGLVINRKIGKAKKLEAGLGLRTTFYTGVKKDFITAGPARYTRTFTAPFAIFFAGQQEQHFDTLQVQRPLTVSFNLTINAGYHFTSRWYAGFNIDLIGFTGGRKSSSIFTGITKGQQGNFTVAETKPTAFNLLLTGDHDKGTLNSEFFLRYHLSGRFAVKAVYQFIFVEYRTPPGFQQEIPGGPLNDRFRNKANNFGIGITYDLNLFQ